MAPTFSRPAELTEEASRIFFIVDGVLRSTSTKPSPALESFPPSFESTPWRRVYMAVGAHSSAYLAMEPWNPSELSAGGARGIFWFFTELPRVGEKICRKTVDGTQTWSGRSGRCPKNGFPVQILVAKLVIKGTAYHMHELTLDLQKPTVALCKIWRTGSAAAESPMSMNEGTSTPIQVEDNLEEEIGMEIYQPQEQQSHMPSNHVVSISDCTMCPNYECWHINLMRQYEGNEQQQHISGHALSMSDHMVHPYSTGSEQFASIGQFGCIEQEPHMREEVASASQHMVHPSSIGGQLGDVEEQVNMPNDVLSLSDYVVLPTQDITQSTCQDDDSIYNHMFQGAVSYLNEEKDSFQHIVEHGRNEAREIASKAESLASALRNVINRLKFLETNIERGNTRPASTTNNNQIRTTEGVTEQSMQATEYTTRDEFLGQEMAQQMEEYSMEDDYFKVDDFINLGGGESN